MAKKIIDHINAALELAGVSSPIRTPAPETLLTALTLYNDMIARWVEDGVEIGAIQSSVPGDESQAFPWAVSAIEYSLALEVCPRMQVDVPAAVLARQIDLYQKMATRARLQEIDPCQAQYDSRLAVGAGNSRGRKFARRFYR
jgi:hypothetical protein